MTFSILIIRNFPGTFMDVMNSMSKMAAENNVHSPLISPFDVYVKTKELIYLRISLHESDCTKPIM